MLVLCTKSVFSQGNVSINDYVVRYKGVAIEEMKKTGIPASILIAQAIAHSDYGNKKLAKEGRNHFATPCGSNWTGEVLYDWVSGEPEQVCFRVYANDVESFTDHAQRIKSDIAKFSILSQYTQSDYRNWATQMHKLYYSSEKNYGSKLINLISTYRLFELDGTTKPIEYATNPVESVAQPNLPNYKKNTLKAPTNAQATIPSIKIGGSSILFQRPKQGNNKMMIQNGLNFIVADVNDSPISISSRLNSKISAKQLMEYNELGAEDKIYDYQYIYLQAKKDKFQEGAIKEYHIVQATETMYEIGQKYGIKTASLLKLNKMTYGEEPAQQEYVYITKEATQKPKLRNAAKEEILAYTAPLSGVPNENTHEKGPSQSSGLQRLGRTIQNNPVTITKVNAPVPYPTSETQNKHINAEKINTEVLSINTNFKKSYVESSAQMKDVWLTAIHSRNNANKPELVVIMEEVQPSNKDIPAEPIDKAKTPKIIWGATDYTNKNDKRYIAPKNQATIKVPEGYSKPSNNPLDGITIPFEEVKPKNPLDSPVKYEEKTKEDKPIVEQYKTANIIAPAPKAAPAAKESVPSNGIYVVQYKDTLYSISKKFSTPIAKIMELNKLSSDQIQTGQILKLK